jgi:hypothetical protein
MQYKPSIVELFPADVWSAFIEHAVEVRDYCSLSPSAAPRMAARIIARQRSSG